MSFEVCPFCGGPLEYAHGEVVCSLCASVVSDRLPVSSPVFDDPNRGRMKNHHGPPASPLTSHAGSYITRSPRGRMLRTKLDEIERQIRRISPLKVVTDQALLFLKYIQYDVRGYGDDLIAKCLVLLAMRYLKLRPPPNKDSPFSYEKIRGERDLMRLITFMEKILRGYNLIVTISAEEYIDMFATDYYDSLKKKNTVVFGLSEFIATAKSILSSAIALSRRSGNPRTFAAAVLLVAAMYHGVNEICAGELKEIVGIQASTIKERASMLMRATVTKGLAVFPWYVRVSHCPNCDRQVTVRREGFCGCGTMFVKSPKPILA